MANKPWTQTKVWATESKFWAWVRGQLRGSIWSNYPVKNEFKDSEARPIISFSEKDQSEIRKSVGTRAKKVAQCSLCNEWFAKSKLEVDHAKETAGTINSWQTAVNFIEHLCCDRDNMQLVCKPCHKAKSYSDRYDVSFDEAKVKKDQIAFGKKDEATQREILQTAGIEPSPTKAGRLRQYKSLTSIE